MTYAKGTKVSVAKSEAELKALLRKHGATAMIAGEDTEQARAFVAFKMGGHQVRLEVPLPELADYATTEAGRRRDTAGQRKAWELACRERWRSVVLLAKAKLEAISWGHSTLEREFMADIMLPDGSTIHQRLREDERWRRALLSGGGPPLLPRAGGGS